MLNKYRGFTLIELLVAISIVAVISSIGFVTYGQTQVLARDSKRKSDLRSLQVALELYWQKNQLYPTSGCASYPSSCVSTTSPTTWIPGVDSYINAMPKDPANNSTYHYTYTTPSGNNFSVCVKLENQDDKDINSPPDFCVYNP